MVGIASMFMVLATNSHQIAKTVEKHCLRSLWSSGVDYEFQKNQYPQRLPGTCQWTLKNPKYLAWRDDDLKRLLWIPGKPGCGKSVLARCIIDEDIPQALQGGPIKHVLYFFFKDTGAEQRSAARAISSILHQLFVKQPELIRHALPSYRELGASLSTTFSKLWSIFVAAITDSAAGNVFFILDALDECDEQEQQPLINAVQQTLRSTPRLKIFITSRPYTKSEYGLHKLLDDPNYVEIEDHDQFASIEQEIGLVVKHRVTEIAKKSRLPEKVRVHLEKRLLQTEHRTYLWLQLLLEFIGKVLSGTIVEMHKLIDNLPYEIQDIYEMLLQRCPDPPLARKMLQIILAAERPLTINEMDIALHIDEQTSSYADLKLEGSLRLEETLRSPCGLMIAVNESKLYFFHRTVRDFLLKEDVIRPHPSRLWQHSLDLEESHQLLTNICLRYLTISETQVGQAYMCNALLPQDRRKMRSNEYRQSYGLLSYTASHWADHHRHTKDNQSMKTIEYFLDCHSRDSVVDRYERQYGTLDAASLGGHDVMVQILLKKGADVNAPNGPYKTALQAASYGGHKNVIQMLLKQGANVNAQGGYYGTAVQAASLRGHDASLEILIEEGADINAQGGHYNTALQAASCEGHDGLVQMLLLRGAHVSAHGGFYGNALQAASSGGHTTIVQMLLEKGADVNAHGGEYGTALHAAAANGHVTTVQSLLDHGAKINASPGSRGSALQIASAREHWGVVKLLVDRGMLLSDTARKYHEGDNYDRNDDSTMDSDSDSDSNSATGSISSNQFSLTSSLGPSMDQHPQALFTVLIGDVFMDTGLRSIYKRLLIVKSKPRFLRILEDEIRELSSGLNRESSTKLQHGTARVLHRYKRRLALRIYEVLEPLTSQARLEALKRQRSASEVDLKEYLQLRYRQGIDGERPKSRQNLITENILPGGGLGETADPYSWNTEHHVGTKPPELDLPESESEHKDDNDADDQSNASNFSDDESDNDDDECSQTLTKESILWLAQTDSFRNFEDYLIKSISPPFRYIEEVLQPALYTPELCSAFFHVDWELVNYTKSELHPGQLLSSVLAVSGGTLHAEALPCSEYCQRTWPTTGNFVLKTVENALEDIRKGIPPRRESSFMGMIISFEDWDVNVSPGKETAKLSVKGSGKQIIDIAQQLAWLGTAYRVPNEGRFARSGFVIHRVQDPLVFKFSLLPLRNIKETLQACWHLLFTNGVLAYGFPIRARSGEKGIEIPFDAMIHLAGISGPIEYRGGLLLKGFLTIIFPKSSPEQASSQWHLIYDQGPGPIPLSSAAQETYRAMWPLKDLPLLTQKRAFLGCYKDVDIHLGTRHASYDRIGSSGTRLPGRKPEFSGFNFTFALPKFGGLSATMNYTLPKRLSMHREEKSYEQLLAYSSAMPLILYDTSDCDRRAWMVPALSVVLHMIHLWACWKKKNFTSLRIAELPYAKPTWNIGQEAQEVIYKSSNDELYISRDDGKPYSVKDLVHRYWAEIEKVVGVERDNSPPNDHVVGWDLMELVTGAPTSRIREPYKGKAKSDWYRLANHSDMPVFFCRGLGEVIVPKPDTQSLCNRWKTVPTEKEYLTASVQCIKDWSERLSGSKECSQLGFNLFWQPNPGNHLFADCSHDDRSSCERVQQLVKSNKHAQSTSDLAQQGAICFGPRYGKLQKQSH